MLHVLIGERTKTMSVQPCLHASVVHLRCSTTCEEGKAKIRPVTGSNLKTDRGEMAKHVNFQQMEATGWLPWTHMSGLPSQQALGYGLTHHGFHPTYHDTRVQLTYTYIYIYIYIYIYMYMYIYIRPPSWELSLGSKLVVAHGKPRPVR